MLTKLTIRNFKRFIDVEIELGNPVVFIGPNNSGKTAALQALALWDIGVKRWHEKRGKSSSEKKKGITINRRDLIAVPIPNANLLWKNLHVRDVQVVEGVQKTKNIRIDIIIEGITDGKAWNCGLEFDYANEESFYCRPLRISEDKVPQRMPVPEAATSLRVAFLPPMSGLAANETRIDPGAINVRLGEGRTAEVLRNLCYQILSRADGKERWASLCSRISKLFGVNLDEPKYIAERGEIIMTYRDLADVRLDLSSSGRGLQQTLLLLAYLNVNPESVLLLDEPDAHLEILRQREIYQILTESARSQGSQIIAASHSEVILNEAADRDVVVAFLGKPHRIDDRGSQLLKSLKHIGFEQYYQAEQTGWVLYLEGSTDLSIIHTFIETLNHPVREFFDRPFVHYVQNRPNVAKDHFFALREAKPDLVGFALFDQVDQPLSPHESLKEYMWKRNEIENYIFSQETLLLFAENYDSKKALQPGPLFESAERDRRIEAMKESIEDIIPRVAQRDDFDDYWRTSKASDVLDRIFKSFFQKLGLPNLMNKSDYHLLAGFVSNENIDQEVIMVLDEIYEIAQRARPIRDEP